MTLKCDSLSIENRAFTDGYSRREIPALQLTMTLHKIQIKSKEVSLPLKSEVNLNPLILPIALKFESQTSEGAQ